MGKLKPIANRLSTIPNRLSTINSTSWRGDRKGGATARGYTYRWEKYRLLFLKANPLCVYCMKTGAVTEATVVDHIIPHQGNQELFWATSNHQALCKTCHDSTKAKEERALGYR